MASKDIMGIFDAVNMAKSATAGLGAVVTLLDSVGQGDIPNGTDLASVLWAVRKDIDHSLDEAIKRLQG